MATIEEIISQMGPAHMERFLMPWLRIQSISDPKFGDPELCRQGAVMLQEELSDIGFNASLIELKRGNPLVWGELEGDPDAPIVLFYGHWDVQPDHYPDKWVLKDGTRLRAFSPTMVEDRMFGRGTSDDKAQMDFHLLALRALRKLGLPHATVKILGEGNEEGGGSSLEEWVRNNPMLKADLVVISDTGTLRKGVPSIITRYRGISVSDVKTRNPEELVRLIDATHDLETSKTLIPGFYDDVLPVEASEEIKRAPPRKVMGEIRPERGFSQAESIYFRPSNDPLLIRYANRDPIEISNGRTVRITTFGPLKDGLHTGQFGGPVQNPGMNLMHVLALLSQMGLDYKIDFIDYGKGNTGFGTTAEAQITLGEFGDLGELELQIGEMFPFLKVSTEEVQERNAYLIGFEERFDDGSPTARLSYRIVHNQTPENVERLLGNFAWEITPRAVVTPNHGGLPYIMDMSNPHIKVVKQALMKGYGTDTVDMIAEGATIPIAAQLAEAAGAPAILWGASDEDSNNHEPLESLLLEQGYYAGARSAAHMYHDLARRGIEARNSN